jgi:hypothetical protein
MNSEEIKIITFLNNFNKKFEKNKLRFITNKKVFNSSFLFFFHLSRSKDLQAFYFKDLLINFFSKSEKVSPGSSYYLSKLIVQSYFKNNEKLEFKDIQKNIENTKKYFSSIVNKDYLEMFFEIISFAGPDATLVCQKTNNNKIKVSKYNSSFFNIEIDPRFRDVFFKNNKEMTKTFITVVLDAYIERESEIMTLIEKSIKDKLPVLLVCRGMSDYAVKSLREIMIKNKAYVLPYTSKFINDDPFMFKDLSEALQLDIVSSEFGDIVSKAVIEKSKLKSLKVSPEKIYFSNIDKNLVEKINKKLSETNNQSLKDYLLKRKKRLSSNVVEINIPNNMTQFLYEIKNLILCYNNILIYGLVKDCSGKIRLKKEIEYNNILSENFLKTFKNLGFVVRQK